MVLYFSQCQLRITLTKEEDDAQVQHNEYCYAGGLVEYVAWLNTDKVCPVTSRVILDIQCRVCMLSMLN
jgi:DNA gyrase/topoisomerase IV subunit B